MICYLNIMHHFEEGLMADERKLNEQPSIKIIIIIIIIIAKMKQIRF